MTEESRVAKRVNRKLESYLNRERVERGFDSAGQGLVRTHPLVMRLELAYLIAAEDKNDDLIKLRQENRSQDVQPCKGTQKRRAGHKTVDQSISPRMQNRAQDKTRVQKSEVNRLSKTAQSTLKALDAEKISTVYRFRQQMVPYQVRHQGKVRQISTNVHAMLNAEEAWRYRKHNDEREKVKKFKEQQKFKAREMAAQEAREHDLARLPVGVRMEIKRQNARPKSHSLLEELLTPAEHHPPTSNHHAAHPYSVDMATEDGFADGEESEYEDDFEDDEDETDVQRVVDVEDDYNKEHEDGHVGDDDDDDTTDRMVQDQNQTDSGGGGYDSGIAAVASANDIGGKGTYDASSGRPGSSPSPSTRRSHTEDATSYRGDSFCTEEDAGSTTDEQSVFMTDGNQSATTDHVNHSNRRSSFDSFDRNRSALSVRESDGVDIQQSDGVRDGRDNTNDDDHQQEKVASRPVSAEVHTLARQLAKTAVKNAAHEEGDVPYSSSNSTVSKKSSNAASGKSPASTPQRKPSDRNRDVKPTRSAVKEGSSTSGDRKRTEEYVRTESMVSLRDRVRKDMEQE